MAKQAPENKTIKVNLAGRPYPVRIAEAEEEGLRAVVEEINGRFSQFQTNYRDRDKQDWLVMTLLTYAGELQALREQPGDDRELDRRLSELMDLVDGALSPS